MTKRAARRRQAIVMYSSEVCMAQVSVWVVWQVVLLITLAGRGRAAAIRAITELVFQALDFLGWSVC